MSIWWVQKNQLDVNQIDLIENLPLRESFLILGPPGSGKTNVLVRRAQFVRGQGMPNILILTFTRPLTEFVKTGCYDAQGREIFPSTCVTTIESWERMLYARHNKDLPARTSSSLTDWKTSLANGARGLVGQKLMPQYDALFVDEAQDLLPEEVELLKEWSPVLFFVGDDRQRIYEGKKGLACVRKTVGQSQERVLPFHYRVAPEICQMADRILLPHNGKGLASSALYNGPKPARVYVQPAPLSKKQQIAITVDKLKEQIRVYGDLIRQGDRLGVIVALRDDRELVFEALENDPQLAGQSKIIRARDEDDTDYDPSFDSDASICILTVMGCKGLEFRAVHWIFADELSHHYGPEHYYTVVTRAKTSLDIAYTRVLPQDLARAHAEAGVPKW